MLFSTPRLYVARHFRALISHASRYSYSTSPYNNILVSTPAPGVTLVTLNRPKSLNALSTPLILDLNAALKEADTDPTVGAIVITGSEKAFAAGADIKEMQHKTFADVYEKNFIKNWGEATNIKKPILAAVNGYALGGGCELALMADIIYAGEKAVFGQPEIKLGIIPGAGGTQRLTRLIGKSRAMELILTGKTFTAKQALEWGLVSAVFSPEQLVDEAVKTAGTIAGNGRLAVQAAKEAVNYGLQVGLEQGLLYERRLFHSLFATEDQKEGMTAFIEKRAAKFKGK
ncbi:ClpP/crotonase-like domain-containing protein [Lipomyces chichibuensis]|uniref:ClpP/crotonase-like domain-containing protein n=1 Tax=Lipomyces chichibuensis TaxID=1546026 RepID=UPI003343A5F7